MLEVKDFIVKKVPPEKRKELNYTEVGRQSLGTLGAWVVNVAVVGCNLGVCAGYMIFISTNLEVRLSVLCARRSVFQIDLLGPGAYCAHRIPLN